MPHVCPTYVAHTEPVFWSDAFVGAAGSPPDPTKWNIVTGLRSYRLEQYRAENVALDGAGHLAITTLHEDYGSGGDLRHYTSGWVDTHLLFSATYGSIEARIQIPAGNGIWPAFWMMPPVNNHDGLEYAELDIMEILGHQTTKVIGTIHSPTVSGNPLTWQSTHNHYNGAVDLSDDFHVYGMEWSPDVIESTLDGVVYGTCLKADLTEDQRWGFDQPFYPILCTQISDPSVGWPGMTAPDETTPWPAIMLVDWVRVSS